MRRIFRMIGKHFAAAGKNLLRHMAMAFSSFSAVTFTLILMATFMIVAGNVTGFTQNVETDLKIRVELDQILEQEAITQLQTKIDDIYEVKDVQFSSKEAEMNTLIEQNGHVFARYKDRNPLPNVFIVEVKDAKDIKSVTKRLVRMEGITDAEYGGEDIEKMISAFELVRVALTIAVFVLGFVAVFLISNTIKMTIYARMNEIKIMRNVGATNWYIKTPFMFEGMYIGLFGSIIPIIISIVGYNMLYDGLHGNLISSMFVLQPPHPFITEICFILAISGIVVGIVGSLYAVNKYLRWNR